MPAYQHQKRGCLVNEGQTEESHFEVAEGRERQAAGGWEVRTCVCVQGGENSFRPPPQPRHPPAPTQALCRISTDLRLSLR